MSTHRKLKTVCLATVLAFGLAACGGSSNDTTMAPMEPATPTDTDTDTEPTSVAVTIPEAPMGYAAMAGTLSIPAGGSSTSGGVMFACAEDGEACEVSVEDDGTATATGGAVTASLTDEAKMAQEDAATSEALTARDRIIGRDRAIERCFEFAENRRRPPTRGSWVKARSSSCEARAQPPRSRWTILRATPLRKTAAMPNGDWAGTRLMRRRHRSHAALGRLHGQRVAHAGASSMMMMVMPLRQGTICIRPWTSGLRLPH